MNARLIALMGALALGAAVPAAASAAQVQTDQACYQDNTGDVVVSGNGFDPSQPYSVALDGKPIGTGGATTEPTGAVNGHFATPQLDKDNAVHTYTLTVTEGANTATTTFSVTPFLADFTPGAGNPKTLRVRFKIFGFGLLPPAHPTVYLHYVRPNGKLKRTVRIGKANGICGQIKRTARRKLFPFNAEAGRWKLQFDTHKHYRKGVSDSSGFLFYTQPVTIKRVFG